MARTPESFAGSPVVVSGAGGFLGSHLTRKLVQEGAEVHALVRPGGSLDRLQGLEALIHLHHLDLLEGDRVAALLGEVRPRVVFHLAMKGGHPGSAAERLEFLKAGLFTTAHLLEACLPLGLARFVHVGSSLEYARRSRPLRESDRLRPATGRGFMKATASLLVRLYASCEQVPAVILRPFSVYGPWEGQHRFIPTVLRAASTGQPVELSPGAPRRDFVFVADVVDACVLAARRPVRPGTTLNVGTGVQHTNLEVIQEVERLTGRSIEVRRGSRPPSPADTECWVSNPEKTRRVLGWQPRFDLRGGLGATLAWLEGHGGHGGT